MGLPIMRAEGGLGPTRRTNIRSNQVNHVGDVVQMKRPGRLAALPSRGRPGVMASRVGRLYYLGLGRTASVQRASSTVVTYMSNDVLQHIVDNHVNLSQDESLEQNKSVINQNWLSGIDQSTTKALGKVAAFVFENGVSAPTSGANDPSYYDYYYNYNKKVGWQETDDGIVWLKGVVVRGKMGNSVFNVQTMFPRGKL
jgi:hypothetical protein